MSLGWTVSNGNATGYQVTGLTPDTFYVFQVLAVNDLMETDGNSLTQAIKTDAVGSFNSIPTLSIAEGGTAISADLSILHRRSTTQA